MTFSRKAFIKHLTEMSKNHRRVIQLRRQDETSDFFLGVSACFGADAEVPRRPDDRHLEKKVQKGQFKSERLKGKVQK